MGRQATPATNLSGYLSTSSASSSLAILASSMAASFEAKDVRVTVHQAQPHVEVDDGGAAGLDALVDGRVFLSIGLEELFRHDMGEDIDFHWTSVAFPVIVRELDDRAGTLQFMLGILSIIVFLRRPRQTGPGRTNIPLEV
jgi:hypothetical protein